MVLVGQVAASARVGRHRPRSPGLLRAAPSRARRL